MASWPVPKFGYAERVLIIPLEHVQARVVDLHFLGITGTVEYDVRYFLGGREHKIRVFEDELISDPLPAEAGLGDGLIYRCTNFPRRSP